MLRLMKLLPSAAAMCCVASAAMAAATAVPPATIKTVFGTGAPFQSSTPSGSGFTITLKPDGSAQRTAKGSTVVIAGKWHVNTTGYCSKWGSNPESCYTLKVEANKYSVIDSTGKAVAIWLPPAPPAAAVAPAAAKPAAKP